jgi:asparagine synthase (glutamine-hydrolysing)
MAHALEVRVPFIDPVVVEYVLGIRGNWKVNGACPKPLLVDAVGDLLPKEIWKRRKMGFILPFQRWMQSALESEVNNSLSRSGNLNSIGINCEAARVVWEAFKKQPHQEPWSRAWALYVFKKWCDLNDVYL